VISDEIYGEMVFAGEVFTPLAALNAARPAPVPLLTVGGLAKRWLVPGWRIGWVLIHDPAGRFGFPLRTVLKDACAIALAPSSITQAAVPAILRDTPPAFYRAAMAVVEANARLVQERLDAIEGLRVVRPRGSLYVLVGVDAAAFAGITDEWDFVQRLVWEEAVFPSMFRSSAGAARVLMPAQYRASASALRVTCASSRRPDGKTSRRRARA
jgi:tyrosine aminotransferase